MGRDDPEMIMESLDAIVWAASTIGKGVVDSVRYADAIFTWSSYRGSSKACLPNLLFHF